MDFSEIYFNKRLIDLSYQDIEQFFNIEKEENQTIEFKSFHYQSTFDSNVSNIIKGVSAFLNSEGGILIWGAPVGKKIADKKEDIFVGDLSPLNILKEKDSLINLISGRITPLPVGVKVKILEKDKQFLYVFEIQESPYKPHQYNDRYYVRLDGQSKPAPHYLVDALIKKISFPDVNGFIKFERFSLAQGLHYLNFSVILSNFSKFQNEENASFQLVLFPGKIVSDKNYWGEYYSKDYTILHCGRPIRENFTITITNDDLIKHKYKVFLSISFGGKYSPARISNYTISLKKAKPTAPKANANKLIVKFEENLLFSDYQERIGKSKDTFIKDIIGRGK